MSATQPVGAMLSRSPGGWIRWGIPTLWLGWVAVYIAGSLMRDGIPQQLDILRWLAPALVPPLRMALKFHGERADVVFLPARGLEHHQLANTLSARASVRRAVQKGTP
ncbi:hypothetical protein A11M_0119410 [Xanthomonas vasicola pv. vasculorum NCPPB 895]|uniref:hypothetical protein n=1 Tax=Xanthomonas vasicola TaxID=56459 RepID=UPI0004D5FD6E|nr:hypothetical protein [Xanthomonas vasicola]AZR34356.1 hypothetical protein NX08_007525 [Xanthomonas vasicola]KEZ95705.1 hypothetical protein A11M_0119410 [Xanthomonas vasicola pv. vasculorum NCPPB 895]KGR51428.1 hypothetical protein NX07_13820 [Xanthomonas vasicola]KGR51531.1 hypothetical protein NX09_18770 [Xanthomonas vasicola]KGT82056.1 hypothetical protein OC00_21440 [Xanthomonas vasicola]